MSFPDIPVGMKLPLVDDTTERLPQPTMDAIAASAEVSATIVGNANSIAAPVTSFVPKFQKDASNPIITATDGAFTSIYWPWVIREGSTYFLYYSTDHDSGAGGIGAMTASSPLGPWVDQGAIYTDTVAGDQTETPSVVKNPTTGLFHMYYQQSGAGVGAQQTLLATSPNPLGPWTRVGVVLDVANLTDQRGANHAGYFRPWLEGDLWIGYCLLGLAYSQDGIVWEIDPRQLRALNSSTTTPVIEWNHIDVAMWGGQRWAVGLYGYGSGVTATRSLRAFRLSADLRHPIGEPRELLPMDDAWESANLRAHHLFIDEGRAYLYYQCDDSIGVAIGDLTWA